MDRPLWRPSLREETIMIPWQLLDTAAVPGGGELRLLQRGAEFSIMAGPIVLMNSRMSGSEQELAEFALERVGHAVPRAS